MKNTNITTGNPLTDEVKVNLDVLGTLMLDRVGRHVYCANVIAVDQDCKPKRSVELLQKLTHPRHLCDGVSNSTILGLCVGPGDGILPFGRPGDQVVTEEHSIARGGLACVRTAGPVCIRVDYQLRGRGRAQKQSKVKSAPDVSEDPLQCNQMGIPWVVHMKADSGSLSHPEGEHHPQTTSDCSQLEWRWACTRPS